MAEEIEYEGLFHINRNNYPKDFEPIYKQEFNPQTLIQFPILLPFHIPVPDGTCVTFFNEGSALTYCFMTITSTQRISPRVVTKDALDMPIQRTRVEMAYATEQDISWEEANLSDYFDDLLTGLNFVLTAYITLTKDVDVYRVSKEMVQFAASYRFVHPDAWDKAEVGIFLSHSDVPYERKLLTKEQQDELVQYANILLQEWNPFIVSEEIALNARRYFKEGFYREAVIYAQINIETFLSILYTNLLIGEGKTEEEAEKLLEDISFISMVKKEFHPRLGGNWNIYKKNTEVGRWYQSTYLLRNRAVHEGYLPTYTEAYGALIAAEDFRSRILSLIKMEKKKYPKLYAYFKFKATN
ncbi:MAG TPA: hypothetical protein VE439_05295 [Anaerolineae bacterium]|nr:hypothetical protein [Anaerolineae bacterium]